MVKENLFTPNCIRTNSGIYMNVFDPTPEMICIEDIAHALSNQARFGGHLKKFYSVAQHSLMCYRYSHRGYEFDSLMHDASEAYLLDIPSPIKAGLSNYKEIEDKLMMAIAEKFGFNYPLSPAVKDVDAVMLQFEWDHLVLDQPLPDYVKDFTIMSHEEAKEAFLNAFHFLTGEKWGKMKIEF